VAVGTFAIYGSINWYTRQIISLNNEERKYSSDDHLDFIPQKLDFDMSFGFVKPLQPEIGYFRV
jgi:hypothetical protein